MMSPSTRIGVALLLLFYVAAFVYSPIGVPHLHHDDEVHQEDSCKKDACHIAIYHPGSQGACDHKYHFTKAVEDCMLCHFLLPRHLVVQPQVMAMADIEITNYSLHTVVDVISSPVLLPADRGPPSLI